MGIRFTCDHCGERLNVKESLAGKRGVCPKCQGRINIPSLSVPSAEVVSQQAAATVAEPTGLSSSNASVELPLVKSTAETTLPAAIHQSPDRLWKVQSGDGQNEYGPAPGATLVTWVREGRIAPTMRLRREDWSDWREAQLVLPEAFPTATSGPAEKNATTLAASKGVATVGVGTAPAASSKGTPSDTATAPASTLSTTGSSAPMVSPLALPTQRKSAGDAPTNAGTATTAASVPALSFDPSAARTKARNRANTTALVVIAALVAILIPLSYMVWIVISRSTTQAPAADSAPAASESAAPPPKQG